MIGHMIFKKHRNIIKSILKILLIITISIINSLRSYSQCDESLVEKAIKNSGQDVLYIRDFKIKNTKKQLSFLSPVTSSEVRLNSGITYRFYVENEAIYKGEALLQVYDDNMMLASTYNFETKTDEKSFDFICPETGNYEVLMSFIEPLEGCAVGIMSVVFTDSLNLSELIENFDISNIIYVGVDNYVDIATDKDDVFEIDVSINTGTIEFENELYKVRVENEGLVKITANVKDSLGNIIEVIEQEFIAKLLKLPRVLLTGKNGGLISKDIMNVGSLKLEIDLFTDAYDFRIIEFTISKYPLSGGYKAYNTEYLTLGQKNLINELSTGDSFYITNILVKSSNNTIYELDDVEFIIE